MFYIVLSCLTLVSVQALSKVTFPIPQESPGSICYTSLKEKGRCVDIRACHSLLSLLEQRQKLEYVRMATCSFNGFVPNVCCPNLDEKPEKVTDVDDKLLLLPEDCGQTIFTRIVGGQIPEIGSWPWIAALGYSEPNSRPLMFLCGGTLISKRYVLTAAHCLDSRLLPIGTSLKVVRLGEYDMSEARDCRESTLNELPNCYEAQDVAVEETIIHENWSRTRSEVVNDIALVRLVKDVIYSDNIQPICLPLPKYINLAVEAEPYSVDPYVAGWGLTRPDSYFGGGSDVLREVRLPIVPLEECKQIDYYQRYTLYKSHLCAGGVGGRDSCKGDSGGGLIIPNQYGSQWFLLGIVSFGPLECGKEGVPGIYTRVTEYIDWILKNIR